MAESDPLRVTLYRDHHQKWNWLATGVGKPVYSGQWVRIESAVANLEKVLGVTCTWVKPRPGQRQLIVTGRPVDVEIRR